MTLADAARQSAGSQAPAIGRAPQSEAQFDAARQFSIEVARLLANTRCHNVVVLDVSGISPVTDFFVLATGTSPRQMKTVCDQAEELGEATGHRAISRSGDDGGSWIVMDCVDVVLHVFSQEARMYYDLDGLWGDAKRVAWEEQPSAPAAPMQ